jgi:uncharacterized protein YdhG (YjbR/CyaY superfamily)
MAMDSTKKVPATIDEYNAANSGEVLTRLEGLRAAVKRGAPDATEAIKYAMPTFVQHGNLVHYAAFKRHISLYPGSKASIDAFRAQLESAAANVGDKGTIQFPNNQPMPYALVTEIVKFRVREETNK